MRASKLVLFTLLGFAGLALFHCSDIGQQTLAPVEQGNFHLFVQNLSLKIDSVDIQVDIDGRRAVAQKFPWTFFPKQFDFQIEEGMHALRAISTFIPQGVTVDFVRSATPYAVVWFGSYDEAPPRFWISFCAESPGFQ
jgi:hypothetical protein